MDERRRDLRRAAIRDDADAARLLLASGVDADSTDSYGWTALMLAAKHRSVDVLRLLLAPGAEVGRRNRFGGTALRYACGSGECVRLLLAAGSDLNERYADGSAPLSHAFADRDSSDALLTSGADVNAADEQGRTALFLAVYTRNREAVLHLLERGAVVRRTGDGTHPDPVSWSRFLNDPQLTARLQAAVVPAPETK